MNRTNVYRYSITALFFFLCYTVSWAQGYSTKIQGHGSKGTVVIKQDNEITRLVDGKGYVAPKQTAPAKPTAAEKPKTEVKAQVPDTTANQGERVFHSIKGFRIQLYSGDDSRNARQTAQQLAAQFKSMFPELPVYTRFFSPHWTCRAGDFRTHEEASKVYQEVCKTNFFKAATIIKCMILVSD